MNLRDRIPFLLGACLLLIHFVCVQAHAADKNVASRSQALVLQTFPAIGVAGSDANKRYVAAVEDAKKRRPALFSAEDWPMQIALELHSVELLETALQTKDYKKISAEAQRFKHVEKDLQADINDLGTLLQKKGSDLENILRNASSVKSAADRLRRNAQVNDNYVPFNPSDNAHKIKADEQRREADALLAKLETTVDKFTSEEREVRDRLSEKFLLLKQKEKRIKNAAAIAPLEEELDDLNKQYTNLRSRYGEPRQVFIQQKLEPKNFPRLGEMLYQIVFVDTPSQDSSILVTRITEFKSTGRAEIHCRLKSRIEVQLTNGFSKETTVFEETVADAFQEARLRDLDKRIRTVTARLESLTR